MVMDFSESSETSYNTAASTLPHYLPPTETPSLALGQHESEKDQHRRRKNAHQWYKLLAYPTRETMCRIVEYTKGPDFTRQDVDLLPWNLEETEVDEEEMKALKPEKKVVSGKPGKNSPKSPLKSPRKSSLKSSMKSPLESSLKSSLQEPSEKLGKGSHHGKDIVFEVEVADNLESLHNSSSDLDASRHTGDKDLDQYESEKGKLEGEQRDPTEVALTNRVEEEHKRRKEERRCKREAVAKKNVSGKDAKKTAAPVDSFEAIKDARRIRAFSWYSQLSTPTRAEFKQRVAAVEEIDISPFDIDLLPWNASGTIVNIAKMNAHTRASIMKQ
jgi:hypothetical protein